MNQNTSLKPIFIVGLISGIISSLIIAGLFFLSQNQLSTTATIVPKTRAMDIIDTYRCGLHETKFVKTFDKEDDYFYEGIEKPELHPDVLMSAFYKRNKDQIREYDSKAIDRHLWGYLEMPSPISKGVFLIKMKPVGNVSSDSIVIGMLNYTLNGIHTNNFTYNTPLSAIPSSDAWNVNNDIHLLDLSKADFNPDYIDDNLPSNLLDYINQESNQVIHFALGDDTSVDFVAMIACVEPDRTTGLTFSSNSYISNILDKPQGTSFLSCQNYSETICNPYKGDTHCDTELPLACFSPSEKDFSHLINGHAAQEYWVNGHLKITAKRAGNSFATSKEATQFCKESFGDQWRVLDFNDGHHQSIFTNGEIEPNTRVWLDIKSQPFGTCWDRE